ncbi:MAG: hypothetical protein ACTHJ9_17420 [Rhodanobacter sp.]
MTDTQREAFEGACNALPEGVNWGDRLTPEIAQHIMQAAQAADAGREPVADYGATFMGDADPEKFNFGADPGDRPLDVKLSRTVEQWAKCDPELMSKCSQAAVFYSLRDAKSDILALAARLRETGSAAINAELVEALEALMNHFDKASYDEAFAKARSALSRAKGQK